MFITPRTLAMARASSAGPGTTRILSFIPGRNKGSTARLDDGECCYVASRLISNHGGGSAAADEHTRKRDRCLYLVRCGGSRYCKYRLKYRQPGRGRVRRLISDYEKGTTPSEGAAELGGLQRETGRTRAPRRARGRGDTPLTRARFVASISDVHDGTTT